MRCPVKSNILIESMLIMAWVNAAKWLIPHQIAPHQNIKSNTKTPAFTQICSLCKTYGWLEFSKTISAYNLQIPTGEGNFFYPFLGGRSKKFAHQQWWRNFQHFIQKFPPKASSIFRLKASPLLSRQFLEIIFRSRSRRQEILWIFRKVKRKAITLTLLDGM